MNSRNPPSQCHVLVCNRSTVVGQRKRSPAGPAPPLPSWYLHLWAISVHLWIKLVIAFWRDANVTQYIIFSSFQFSSPPVQQQQLDFYDSSPMFLRRSSLTSSLNEDEDDGFMDILDDNMEVRRVNY